MKDTERTLGKIWKNFGGNESNHARFLVHNQFKNYEVLQTTIFSLSFRII